MTTKEAFICPNCGKNTVALYSSNPIMSDLRVDALGCKNCGAEWRVYSRIAECTTEIMYIPQPSVAPQDVEAESESTPDTVEE